MKQIKLLMASLLLLLTACNKDEEILQDPTTQPPVITLDSDTGIYTVKVGREVSITPSYQYATGASYTWICDGQTLSTQPAFHYTFTKSGAYYLILRVETPHGKATEELRVDVLELAPPVISLAIPQEGLQVVADRDYRIAPEVKNNEGATYRWLLNDSEVSTEATYTFRQQALGSYRIAFHAQNEDGKAVCEFTIEVVDRLPAEVVVVSPTYLSEPPHKTVVLGSTLYLRPYVSAPTPPTFQWSVNGTPVEGATQRLFAFTPAAEGEYTLTFTMSYMPNDQASAASLSRHITAVAGSSTISLDIPVVCLKQAAAARPFTAGCSVHSNKVYEYLPAPGQFINETRQGGYNGEKSHAEAIAYAERRLSETKYVSLGGWGGSIIVGFDHSIENKGGNDFSITGNAFDGSSEPGIVYVMQDTNGNGLPDEEWYELKGSEYGKEETLQEYAVTYYRPAAAMDTQWEDNLGNKGCIDYLKSYHPQEYYYPLWVEADSYTLYGVRLQPRTIQDTATGLWVNQSFAWGYADNFADGSTDNSEAAARKVYFQIANAVHLDGSAANLTHIDFVKVQTGVNMKAGWLGENSTEVFGFTDENNYTE